MINTQIFILNVKTEAIKTVHKRFLKSI